MSIIMNISIYLVCGVVLVAMMDTLANLFDKTAKLRVRDQVAIIVFWPVYLIMFIYHFIKANNEGG